MIDTFDMAARAYCIMNNRMQNNLLKLVTNNVYIINNLFNEKNDSI